MEILVNRQLINIVIPHSESFSTWYILLLVMAFSLILYSGLNRKFPVSTWLTLTSFILFAFIFGIELFPYSGSGWIFLSKGDQEIVHSKSLVGGVLFLLIAVVFIKNFLRIKPSIFDPIILILPFLGIVQRINCLFSGCCYGKPSGLPWAIQYSRGSSAWIHHVNAGLINPDASLSLSVHPTQIYTILALLLIILIILKTRHFWKVPGNLSVYALLLFSIERYTIEFIREPTASGWYSMQFLGMDGIQWIILILFPIISSVLVIREKHGKYSPSRPLIPVENLPRNTFILLLMVFISWNAGRIIESGELLMIQCLITIAFAVNAIRIVKLYAYPFLRYPGLLAILSTFLLTSQQNVETKSDSLKVEKNNGWFSIGGNYGLGNYDKVSYDCNGNETSRISHNYDIRDAGLTYHLKPQEYQHLMFGLNYYHFYDRSETQNPMQGLITDSYSFTGINPYVNLDFHYVGIGAGAVFNYNMKGSNAVLSPQMPTGYIRIGKKESFFVFADAVSGFHMGGIADVWQLGAGTGFGSFEKQQLTWGITTIDGKLNFFLAGKLLLNRNFMLESNLTAGNNIHGSIGLQYHFGANRWNPKNVSKIISKN